MRARSFVPRVLGALVVLLVFCAGVADATVTVNKYFYESTGTTKVTQINVGDTSVVKVTLQNSDTTGPASITSFLDDISTMGTIVALNTDPASASAVCVNPTNDPTFNTSPTVNVSGTQVTANNFEIAAAPSVNMPATCIITFQVFGNQAGTGINTINNVQVNPTTLNPESITQTLTVNGINTTVVGPTPTTVTAFVSPPAATTQNLVYTIQNPAAGVNLTNAAFTIGVNSVNAFSIGNVTTDCGATASPATLSSTGASNFTGTLSFTGGSIPKKVGGVDGTCTVTIPVTSSAQGTVNTTFAAGSLSDFQGVTNTNTTSGAVTFSLGQPNLGKSFSPSTIQPVGNPAPAVTTSTLTLTIANVLPSNSLTNAAITDTLPANLSFANLTATTTNCGTAPGLAVTVTNPAAPALPVLTLTGGTIAPGATCRIQATVQGTATATNTVPAANFTANVDGGAAIVNGSGPAHATLNVTSTGGAGDFSVGKSVIGGTPAGTFAGVNVPGFGVNVPLQFKLTFGSIAGSVFTTGSFTDDLSTISPSMQLVYDPVNYPYTIQNCSAPSPAAAPTLTATPSNNPTLLTGSNLYIAAGQTCTIYFYAKFTQATGLPQTVTNTVSATFANSSTTPPGITHTASAMFADLPAIYAQNYTQSNQGLVNQILPVQGAIVDSYGVADTGGSAVFKLNPPNVHSVVLANSNFTFSGCPAGISASSITVDPSKEFFTVHPITIAAGTIFDCLIGYNVTNEVSGAAGAGVYNPDNPTYQGPLTGGVAVPTTATGSVTFSTSSITPSISYLPTNNIQAGAPTTTDISLNIAGVFSGNLKTVANNVSFTDPLPTGVIFTSSPNVTFSNCGTNPAPSYTISTVGGVPQIAFSNITLTANGPTSVQCDVEFNVTSNHVGAPPPNTIPAGAVTSKTADGLTTIATNAATVSASLTVLQGIAVQKTFVLPTVPIGGSVYARFLLSNSFATNPVVGSVSDHLPATLQLASTALGPLMAGDTVPLCGGSVTSGAVGTGGATIVLSGLTVPAFNSAAQTAGQCVVYLALSPAATATAGTVSTNTLNAGDVVIGGVSNLVGSSATVTTTAAVPPPAGNVVLTKTFAPATIASGASSTLTITVANTGANAVALSALALTDPLPANVTVASTPGASTTCTGGTVTAVAGGSSVGLTGGNLAANATCTVTLSVTGTLPGAYTNTIPASSVTTAQGATNTAAAQAILTVTGSGLSLAKSFAPAAIAAGGTSTLTISIGNAGTNAVALTALALSDALPANVTIAATPNAATTCTGGTVTAVAGGTSVALAGGSLAAGGSCAITVAVTGTLPGAYVNTIPAGAVTTTQAVTNVAPAQATLSIGTTGVTVAKSFAPATIAPGATSTLTISVSNSGASAVALTSLALTDALPANVTIAATPNAATTCPSGTVTAAPGGSSVTLGGASLAAGATCTITLSVTGTITGSYTNTIPAGAIATAQGSTNGAPASAVLTIASAATVIVSKSFSPLLIAPGATSALTITLANPNTIALSSVALSDALPTNVTVAAQPNAATTCTSGTVTAAAGAASVALAGASMAAGATCTVTLAVTGTIPGSYTNTIPANAVTSAQSATNPAPAQAPLVISSLTGVAIAKSFSPVLISPGAISTLTIALTNPNTTALSAVALSDSLPANVAIAAQPNASTTCASGSVTAVAGSSSVSLGGATLAASATCTVTLAVTGTVPGTYTNTIPAGALTSAQGDTNPAPAEAALTISGPTTVTIAKSFTPVAIVAGGTSTLTVTVNNGALNAVPLSSVALSDALPAGVTVAPSPNPATTCAAGTVAAAPGGTSIALSGASLPAFASCSFSVSVTAAAAGSYVNTIPAAAMTDAQGASNVAPAQATLIVGNGSTVGITKTFSPPAIPVNGTSVETITLSNTSSNAVPLSGLLLVDTLPPGVTIYTTPNAGTTCGGGTVTATPGGSTTTLRGGTLAAGATCTITVTVTSSVSGVYLNNTIPSDSLTDNQGSTNVAPATAALNVGGASPIGLAKSFAPVLISPLQPSILTITLSNTGASAVPLTAVGLTDALPANITVATTPNVATTCTGGTATATAGASTVALTGAGIAANATCTITVAVTGTVAGTYVNTIPVGAVTSAQAATNPAAAQASLTIGPTLVVSKTSLPSNADVSPGQTIAYTIVVKNTGTQTETNATVKDVMTNATLVPGSVTVNGAAAADAVIASAQPFGSIAPGASATVTYSAIVNLSAPSGAAVTNNVTAGGDQPCPAAACAASSATNTVEPPVLTVNKLLDGQQTESVVPGQTVTYGITVVNTSTVPSYNSTITDVIPAGYSAVPGSVTLNGAALPSAMLNGQTLTIPIGTIAGGATVLASFKAVIMPNASSAGNTVSVAASGVTPVTSNAAMAHVVPPTIAVTKSTTATTVTSGDRVDYTITAAPTNGVPYGVTTIIDALPAYEIYAPGTSRVNGKAVEPVVQGRTLTWTVPSLAAMVTITYSTAIAPGAPQNSTLTNTVNVTAIAPGGTGRGQGSASASVLIVGSTFGSCYPITGRVYLDVKGSGRFEDPDVGLARVHLFLDNGESVTTDSTGRYDFPCVHPGMHALRLDETTLPAGVVPYDDRNIDSEKSTRRLIHRIFDTTIIEDINFAVTGTPIGPSTPVKP